MAWIENLSDMVNNMKLNAIQTNPKKCVFGHFYYIIKVKHPAVADDWKSIADIHNKFHAQGQKAITAIETSNEKAAREALQATINLSDKLMLILDEVENKIKQLDAKNENAV